MAEIDSVFSRMKQARVAAGVPRRENISQERMADLVSAELGRVLHTTQWRRYETDREPPLDVIDAAAKISGLSRDYIAFGAEDIDIDPNVTPGQNARYAAQFPREPTQRGVVEDPASDPVGEPDAGPEVTARPIKRIAGGRGRRGK